MKRRWTMDYRLSTTLLLVVFCAFGFLNGCGKKREAVKEEAAIPVKVRQVKCQDIRQTLDYVGNIKGQDEAVVYPKVNGKISEKVKEDGSPVIKGEVIAYLDRDEVGFKFEKAPVESPLSGIIGRVYVDIGSNITPQTPVALVVDMDRIKIDLDIPEKYLPKISLGQEARITVDAYPGEEFTGKVARISPVLDLETRAAPIEIIIDNQDHRLKSGMFARAKLVIQEYKNVPVILKEAIMGKAPDLYVYVVENNKAILRKITLGLRQGAYFEVSAGLKGGDLVVIMGQPRLRDKAEVSVEEEKE